MESKESTTPALIHGPFTYVVLSSEVQSETHELVQVFAPGVSGTLCFHKRLKGHQSGEGSTDVFHTKVMKEAMRLFKGLPAKPLAIKLKARSLPRANFREAA